MIWKNILELDRPQITIRHVRIACWIPKATNTLLEYVILIAFPKQQWLHERASTLRCAYITCLILNGRLKIFSNYVAPGVVYHNYNTIERKFPFFFFLLFKLLK